VVPIFSRIFTPPFQNGSHHGIYWWFAGKSWGFLETLLAFSCFSGAPKIWDLEVKYSSRWVPKSRTKLTRTLWYTLGTAHEFDRKRPCNQGFSSTSLTRTALKSGLNNPRGPTYLALDHLNGNRTHEPVPGTRNISSPRGPSTNHQPPIMARSNEWPEP
jgi:hypothetical protein